MDNMKETKEIKKILPKKIIIEDKFGNPFEVDYPSIGQELEIVPAFIELFDAFELTVDKAKDLKDTEFLNMIASNKKAHKIILKIVSILMDKDIKWINENMSLFDIIPAYSPFFVTILPKLMKLAGLIKPLTEAISLA